MYCFVSSIFSASHPIETISSHSLEGIGVEREILSKALSQIWSAWESDHFLLQTLFSSLTGGPNRLSWHSLRVWRFFVTDTFLSLAGGPKWPFRCLDWIECVKFQQVRCKITLVKCKSCTSMQLLQGYVLRGGMKNSNTKSCCTQTV